MTRWALAAALCLPMAARAEESVPPEPSIAADLEGVADDAAFVLRARGLMGQLAEAGDFARAQAVARHAGTRYDPRAAALLEPVERVLLGILAEDFAFLRGLRQGPPFLDPTAACCARDSDRLGRALRGQLAVAVRRVRHSEQLEPADRRLLELLLDTALLPRKPEQMFARSPEIERRARLFLDEFPEAPHRRLVLADLVEQYRPGRFALNLQLSGLLGRFDRDTRQDFTAPAGGGFSLDVEYQRMRLGGRLLVGFCNLRNPLVSGGEEWPAGKQIQWTSFLVSVGHRIPFDRFGLTFTVGAGRQNFSNFREGRPPLHLPLTVAMASLGHELAVLRGSLNGHPRNDDRFILGSQVVVTQALSRHGDLAPTTVLFQLGAGFETRSTVRVRE